MSQRSGSAGLGSLAARDRIRGCLLGGAVGDALGARVEFLDILEIRRAFGVDGITHYAPAYHRRGAITDDTQMTLFTADGLIRAWTRGMARGEAWVEGAVPFLLHAYLRWLRTQNEKARALPEPVAEDGWIATVDDLRSRRAPGTTCLSALRGKTSLADTVAENDSKGCGGVMRVAPIGLLAPAIGDDAAVFRLGADSARITHGHPSGCVSAGHCAVVIAALSRGETLDAALDAAQRVSRQEEGHEETLSCVDRARARAALGRPTPEDIESLGGGWVGEEALAIAVLCALTASDFDDCVRLAANHSGDSDSTAAIAGNIFGAWHGMAAIDPAWLPELDLRDEITTIADDLAAIATGTADPAALAARYPRGD